MSLNYTRELLKISLSQLCDRIGFDSTTEITMDILIDVCEREFVKLMKQTSNLLQLTDRSQVNFFDILSILMDNQQENLHSFSDYMKHFQSLPFSKPILQFPFQKKTQFYLRIPPKDSAQVLERDSNQTTDYIYDWLPLFPDQETPEQTTTNHIDTTFGTNLDHDQEKKIDKNDSHHPLTLFSFLSKNGDETSVVPVGKRPNRALPSILYRPRRIIEMEAAISAEKAKKEQMEKENNDKDQQQGPPLPIRLTIPKPNPTTSTTTITTTLTTTTSTTTSTTEKISQSIKKSLTTPSIDGILMKKSSTNLSLNTNPLINNSTKKTLISPPLNQFNESSHSQPNPSTTIAETHTEKSNDVALDLTKPSSISSTQSAIKLPTLKLNIKNVNNNNNSEMPATATKKFSKPSINTHEKVNLKIRTSSVPLFGGNNELTSQISPSFTIPNEIHSNPIESSINVNLTMNEKKSTTEISDPTNRVEQISTDNFLRNEEDKKKKKKKKKKHHEQETKEEKKVKIEQENRNNDQEQSNNTMEIPPILSIPNETIPPPPSQSNSGAIRLKIKLGKPTIPTEESSVPTNFNDNIQPILPEKKPDSLVLKLPLGSKSSINRTPQRQKSTKLKRLTSGNVSNPIVSHSDNPFHEDNTNSIDDLPLGERTSPNKPISTNIGLHLTETLSSTPIKKKSITIKKKSNPKKVNNIVGVAVIEERRINHDSQEKIWICPSCNIADNGQEPMIQCDLCDDWYHWECVGIAEEPPESIPWFCPKCHRSNSSTASAQNIKPSASSKAKRKRASVLYQQKQQQQQQQTQQYPLI
ncbi:unnamed protein product [Adineta ricciae]|uniref:PHD-type domain-containing protein n=1 Tax=Adineta ricciae TaxID=249248 RepID=A0A815JVG2_ADIRI|nr:unnamed protein product [Adineta ricciae]